MQRTLEIAALLSTCLFLHGACGGTDALAPPDAGSGSDSAANDAAANTEAGPGPNDAADARAGGADGGDMGPAADTGGATCSPDPTPAGGGCPDVCTGGCKDGVCTIDCAGPAKCDAMGSITCPEDFACSIVCKELDACDGLTIDCPSENACHLVCDGGKDACGDVTLNCGAGSCTMACGSPNTVCDGSAVKCGGGPCSVSCAHPPGGVGATQPDVTCGGACACATC